MSTRTSILIAAILILYGAHTTGATSLTNPGGTGGGGGSGTISGVTAGTGLSGGGTSGNVTLNLSTPVSAANGGLGVASPAAHGILVGKGSSAAAAVTCGNNLFLAGVTSADPACRALSGSDLPNPSTSTLGGVESLAATSHQWMDSISTSGAPHSSQPSCVDLTGAATHCGTAADELSSGNVPAARLGTQSSVAAFYRALTCASDTSNSQTTNGATRWWVLSGEARILVPRHLLNRYLEPQ